MTHPKTPAGTAPDSANDVSLAPSNKKPYEAPELKEFGPMTELTQLGDGPADEDLILYGGPS